MFFTQVFWLLVFQNIQRYVSRFYHATRSRFSEVIYTYKNPSILSFSLIEDYGAFIYNTGVCFRATLKMFLGILNMLEKKFFQQKEQTCHSI